MLSPCSAVYVPVLYCKPENDAAIPINSYPLTPSGSESGRSGGRLFKSKLTVNVPPAARLHVASPALVVTVPSSQPLMVIEKLTPEVAIDCSLSGPMLRGSGVAWDIRKADPYCVYDKLEFDICVGTDGDAYDRFLVRLAEMRQSIHILKQCLEMMPDGPVHSQITTATSQPGGAPSAPLVIRVPAGEAYGRIESPRGELGFYIVSDGGPAPYRFHIRSPSLINLTPLRELAIGATVADAIVILGSIDIVVGEIDR